ncbi:ABC transporter substrate-binding protein [Paenibacillus sp. GCM10027627]|uniref:ABC transporter substrate-binding protein n=1 Tax=unclassified Paenibacillus TaxID=185978 RepID=UPI00362C222D
MKVRRHYFLLREAYPEARNGEPIEVTTSELAETLDCTQRNMVLLLRRMEQEGWIVWTPKRGRGNRSLLLFKEPLESLLLEEAEELALRGNLQAALELLQQKGAGTAAMGQFQQRLTGQFGFRSELEGTRRKDMLRFPLPGTIGTLDPVGIHYIGESHLVNQLYDSLVRMDVKGGDVLPHLAHAWETNEERTEWTFYLRKGVFFHHGREMTSSDVKYTLERLQKRVPSGLYSWVYNAIEGMETPDETTVRIRLKERNEAFLSFLSTNRSSIVPKDICETEGEAFGSAQGMTVGTGPFRLLSGGQGIWILEAFPNYFKERPFLDRVEVWTMPAEPGQMEKEKEEWRQFQVMHNVRLTGMAGRQWQQVRQSGTTCKFITVNELKGGPLVSHKLREALNAAINRTELLRLLSGDVIESADSFWPSRKSEQSNNSGGGSKPGTIRHVSKDSLKEMGYNGEALVLLTIPQYGNDAAMIKNLLEKAGFTIEIRLVEVEQLKGSVRMEADLLLFAVMLDEHRELRLIDLFKNMRHRMEPSVREQLEESIRRLLAEPNPDTRAGLFVQMEERLTARHSLLFLYRKHLKTAFHPSVQGISLESLGWVRFRDLWFR